MIPKLIHNIWIQGYDQLPEKKKQNHIEIKKLNPDWDFIVWDNKTILQLLQKYPLLLSLYKKVDQLSGIITREATQSDIARYVILKEYGGLYYDVDFECVSSFQELFSEKEDVPKETVYIASSQVEILDCVWPSVLNFFGNKPRYCSCFMAFQKNHPIWDKVFLSIQKTSSKYTIGHALDSALQENNYPIVILERIGGHYVCSKKDQICFTPVESSWNPFRSWLHFVNCNGKQIILFLLIFIIIFIVEKINHFNVMKFGLTTFIPGLPSTAPPVSQPIISVSKGKKERKRQR
jgi:hypothetical protein